MQDGKYTVKVIDAGLGTSQAGVAQPWVKFQNEAGESITWYGNLSGKTAEGELKAQEITIKALVAAGFTGSDFADLNKPWQDVFAQGHTVSITVATEEYNGKSRQRVKYVDAPKAPQKFMGQAPKMAAVFAKARKEIGIKAPAKTDDAPF